MEAVKDMEKQQNWWEDRADQYYETMYITDAVKSYVTGRRAKLAVDCLAEGDRLLDLGVGTGTIFEEILKMGGIRGTGMDYTQNMVRIARSKKGNSPAAFLQGNGIKLPFQDSSFDLVFSVDVFHHIAFEGFDYVDQALAEAHRVLSPGGTLLIYEANPLNVYWYYYMWKIGEDNARPMRRGFLLNKIRQAGFDGCTGSYMGFVPEFLSPAMLNAFRGVERFVEGMPLLNKLCSNYYIAATKK
jgi:ubiquinone/menaquinone biosynthesis C-methylase UbiE